MIYFPFSKFVDSSEATVAPGASISAEGQALVRAVGANASGVTVSAGTPPAGTSGFAGVDEAFAGFSVLGVSAAPLPMLYATKVEQFTVPGSGIVQLAQTPVAGQLAAFDLTANAAVATPTVVGSTVTTLTAGNVVRVTYQYATTSVQSRSMQGDVQPGGYAGQIVGQTGVVKRGTIFTDQYDASKNWAAATSIKLAANGHITDQSGTGCTIPGYVVSAPSTDTPYLGIEFSAV
jgi:hypothetical protein